MRIFCFSELVSTESKELLLKDCSVVIDGTNYLHNIYEISKLPFVFGCESDKYAECLKKQLTMFKKANVKCYIVFKGGDMDIEKKMKRFQNLVFDINTNKEFIPPELLKDINVQVVEEMGIDYTFCVAEAKDECVALAQKLECPVISFDVEYCFRKASYIPSWKGDPLKFDEKTKSIKCRQFKLKDFLQNNSLTEEKTAIFAALTDYTLFPNRHFDSLFHYWGIFNKNAVYKLRNLILWLSKHSEQEARDGISKILTNDEDRRKFKLYYNKILTDPDPEWFEKGVICKHVALVYINLYKWKVIQGSWVILDTHGQDSLLLSIDIIKYAYNLLTNYRGDRIKVYQDASKYVEMQTDDTNVCRPIYHCKESVFENGWDQVKQLKLFEHFLTENCINTEVLAKLQPDSVVLFTALVYYARKKELEGENVTREVYAVILSYVLLSLVFNTETCSKDLKDEFAKYFQYDEGEAKRIFDGKTSEKLVELQFCIQHMNYLNTLCGSPYKSTQYSKIYNGTFIYKICSEMRDRNVDDFINELFHATPVVLGMVKRFIQVFREFFYGE